MMVINERIQIVAATLHSDRRNLTREWFFRYIVLKPINQSFHSNEGVVNMKVNLNFTNKGQAAITKFSNEELLEIFARYSNTLMKKYSIEVKVPEQGNDAIVDRGVLSVDVDQIECDVETYFKELGRDVKVPLKKRLSSDEKLDNVFKIEVVE